MCTILALFGNNAHIALSIADDNLSSFLITIGQYSDTLDETHKEEKLNTSKNLNVLFSHGAFPAINH